MRRILTSREHPEDMQKALDSVHNFLLRIVNYGEVVYHFLGKRMLDQEEDNPLETSFIHMLDVADSIAELIRIGSAHSASILLRTLYETSLNIMYMNKVERKKGVLAYRVSYLRTEIKKLEKLNRKNHSSHNYLNKHKEIVGEYPPQQNLSEIIKARKEMLNSSPLLEVNEEYQRVKKRNNRDPYWHSLYNGPKNVEKLAEEFDNMWILYHYLYKDASGGTHGSNTLNRIAPDDSNSYAVLTGIRNPDNIEYQAFMTASMLLNVFFQISNSLGVKYAQKINNWYVEEIREEYKSLTYDLNFKVSFEGIKNDN